MRSQAIGFFPQFRFADGRKWLFNPILKKRFVSRPEERVRLRYVDFLLQQTAFSKNRIAFETPVKSPESENTLRADLVLYGRDLKPFALIECKSEKIKLNESTAMQSARYNRQLDAPFLMITNGVEDHWFIREANSITPAGNPIEMVANAVPDHRPPEYWSDRGFIHPDLSGKLREIASRFLNRSFSLHDSPFLRPPDNLSPFEISHYYAIVEKSRQIRLAYTMLFDSSNQTRLVCILNRGNRSSGLLWIGLPGSPKADHIPGKIIRPDGRQSVEVPASFIEDLNEAGYGKPEKFENRLINFFD